MTITATTWRTAKKLQARAIRDGVELTSAIIADGLQVSRDAARYILFGLDNEDVIRSSSHTRLTTPAKTDYVICDLHIPYADDSAINAALSYADQLRPDCITILGDLLDFYKISRFGGRPDRPSVSDEIHQAREFLSDLRRRYPRAAIRYLVGNHEERLNKYIESSAPELYTLLEELLPNKLGLSALNIEYYDSPFTDGELLYIHGHEIISGIGKQICDPIFSSTYTNTLLGHAHRQQQKIYKSALGKVYTVNALACLCQPMDYQRFDQWSRGFGVVKFNDNGTFFCESHTIDNGQVY